jgi:hypothetical protein
MKYKYTRIQLSQAYGGYDHDEDFIEDLLAQKEDRKECKHKWIGVTTIDGKKWCEIHDKFEQFIPTPLPLEDKCKHKHKHREAINPYTWKCVNCNFIGNYPLEEIKIPEELLKGFRNEFKGLSIKDKECGESFITWIIKMTQAVNSLTKR